MVVLVAVALAVVLAGVGLYADGRPAPCTAVVSTGGGGAASERIRRRLGIEPGSYCTSYARSPLTEQAARWWWSGAAAVLVLGLATVPLARRR
jgi:hypothetical protein